MSLKELYLTDKKESNDYGRKINRWVVVFDTTPECYECGKVFTNNDIIYLCWHKHRPACDEHSPPMMCGSAISGLEPHQHRKVRVVIK